MFLIATHGAWSGPLKVEAARFEVRCNIPVFVELDRRNNVPYLDSGPGWEPPSACTPEAAVEAFSVRFTDDCRHIVSQSDGAVFVRLGERASDGTCVTVRSALDEVWKQPGEDPQEMELMRRLYERRVTIPTGINNYRFWPGSVLPGETVRDYVTRTALAARMGERRQRYEIHRNLDETGREEWVVRKQWVGGPYSYSSGAFGGTALEGPYDGRTEWWKGTNEARFRPYTSEEKRAYTDLIRQHQAGTISDLEYEQRTRAIREQAILNPRTEGAPWLRPPDPADFDADGNRPVEPEEAAPEPTPTTPR